MMLVPFSISISELREPLEIIQANDTQYVVHDLRLSIVLLSLHNVLSADNESKHIWTFEAI